LQSEDIKIDKHICVINDSALTKICLNVTAETDSCNRLQLYCRLPSGYVDPNTYYLEPEVPLKSDSNFLQLNDLNRRASLPTTIDVATDGYDVYGQSVLSSVLQLVRDDKKAPDQLLDLSAWFPAIGGQRDQDPLLKTQVGDE
jgi:hypothetical protein